MGNNILVIFSRTVTQRLKKLHRTSICDSVTLVLDYDLSEGLPPRNWELISPAGELYTPRTL